MHIEDYIADLTRYKDWSPTACDTRGLGCDDRQDWYVVPTMRTRDSGPLEESNFAVALESLGGESGTVEVHRFGHWGPGWFEIILAHPDHGKAVAEIMCSLSDYLILNEHDFSAREQVAADEAWASCYSTRERIEYIREHRSQFEFRGFADMLGCVRGKYFAGDASELIG